MFGPLITRGCARSQHSMKITVDEIPQSFTPFTLSLTFENANEAHAVYELLRSTRVNDYLETTGLHTRDVREAMRKGQFGDKWQSMYSWMLPQGAAYDNLVNDMIDEA
jgi:hypothetical protein